MRDPGNEDGGVVVEGGSEEKERKADSHRLLYRLKHREQDVICCGN